MNFCLTARGKSFSLTGLSAECAQLAYVPRRQSADWQSLAAGGGAFAFGGIGIAVHGVGAIYDLPAYAQAYSPTETADGLSLLNSTCL